jgi:hypothetical protein
LQHGPVVSSAKNKHPAQATSEKVEWEASSTPAVDALAAKTSDYATKMQTGGAEDPFRHPEPPEAATALLGTPRHRNKLVEPEAPTIDPTPVAPLVAPPVEPSAGASAQLSSAKITPAIDGPKIVPESADFASSDSLSKDAMGVKLRKRVASDPHDIANQLDLQLYGMLNDDPSPELASVSELPSEDRELVAALVDGISNFRSTVREDSNMLQAKKIQPLLEMADRLRSQADLTVSTVALCRRVEAFGKYDPIVPLRFPAAQENPAIVYCEVQNFLPRQNSRQMWETKLSEQVNLYTDTGVLAWSDTARQVTDECRNRRHDFFAYNIIKMPSSLTMGRYVLKVTVEDQNAGRVAEATVPLEIVAKVSNVASGE